MQDAPLPYSSDTMVDPTSCTVYDLEHPQLEEFLFFAVCVAGKKALTIAKALDRVLTEAHDLAGLSDFQPFKAVLPYSQPKLQALLKKNGIGCHELKSECMYALCRSGFDLKTVPVAELEKVRGIGSKTARFFVLHTRKDVEIAALDTHMLSYMRDLGLKGVPATTPPKQSKKYYEWQTTFIELAARAQMTIADFDLSIWKAYSSKNQEAKDQLLSLVRRRESQ